MTADLQRLRELMGKLDPEVTPRYDMRCHYREAIADALPSLLDRLDKAEAVCEAFDTYQSTPELCDLELSTLYYHEATTALAAWRKAVPRE